MPTVNLHLWGQQVISSSTFWYFLSWAILSTFKCTVLMNCLHSLFLMPSSWWSLQGCPHKWIHNPPKWSLKIYIYKSFYIKYKYPINLKKKKKKKKCRFTCSLWWWAYSLLSNLTRRKACFGTSRPIFNKHLASRITSVTLGSKLTNNFPVAGWRTSSVIFKTVMGQIREKLFEIGINRIPWCNLTSAI